MRVSVCIAVGPSEANRRWLDQAIKSVAAQTYKGGVDLVLVDDMADVERNTDAVSTCFGLQLPLMVYKMPWYSGVAHAFNAGVAVAPSDYVFMLGSDDWLEPECIERCVEEWESKHGDPFGYYYVGVRYSDNGETQTVPCQAAMVSKPLWHRNGGFPLQSASGAPDAALLSIIIGNYPRAGRPWPVADGHPLYNYRRHAESDTASKAPWQSVILETRQLVTLEWRPRGD
jgi:glycosyltransferase involved in cell wall biosynthesis